MNAKSLALLFTLIPLAASAGYREALEEVDSYSPPAWLSVQPQAEAAASPQTRTRLAEGEYAPPPAAAPFFTPDENFLAALKGVFDDETSLLAHLGARLDPGELRVIALKRSPRILAALADAQSARDSMGIARSLSETLRAYGPFTDSSMPGVGALMKEGDSYPFPGVASLRASVAAIEARLADEKAQGEVASVLSELSALWWKLRFVAYAASIGEERLALLRSLEQSAGARYASGEGMMGELAMIRSEVEMAREELVSLARERRAMEDSLLSLLALPGGAPLASPERGVKPPEVGADVARLAAAARESNRDIAQMRLDVTRMETMVAMGEAMNYAQPDLGGTLFENRTAAQVGTMAMEPAFNATPAASEGEGAPRRAQSAQEYGYLAQTKKRLAGAKSALAAEEYATDAMVREAWTGWDEGRRSRILYRERVGEYARLALDTTLSAYRTGNVTFPMVLAAYRSWLEAVTAAEEAATRMGMSAAELEKLIGTSPLPTEARGMENTK